MGQEKYFLIISILPSLVLIFGFTIYPFIYAIQVSIIDFKIGSPYLYQFVGLKNFLDVFVDPAFINSLRVTAIFIAVTVPVITLLSLAIALILNQDFKGNILLRASLLIPWAMPGVSAAALWNWIFDADFGIWNGALYVMGLIESYQPWKSEPLWALIIVTLVHIWKFVPLSTILILAALANIPKVLYETAEIDGAGLFKRFRMITLPQIKPILGIIIFLQTVYALLWHFVWIFVITRGGPGSSTETLPWLTYIKAFAVLDFGRGSALGIILALFVALLFPIFLRRIRLRERE